MYKKFITIIIFDHFYRSNPDIFFIEASLKFVDQHNDSRFYRVRREFSKNLDFLVFKTQGVKHKLLFTLNFLFNKIFILRFTLRLLNKYKFFCSI